MPLPIRAESEQYLFSQHKAPYGGFFQRPASFLQKFRRINFLKHYPIQDFIASGITLS